MRHTLTLTMNIDDEVSHQELLGHIHHGEYAYIVQHLATDIKALVTDMSPEAVRARIIAEDGPYA